MLLLFDFFSILFWIYLIAAVLPGIVILLYVMSVEKTKQISAKLVFILLALGAAAAIGAALLEEVADGFLLHFFEEDYPVVYIILTFFSVGIIEEGVKLLFLRLKTWADQRFEYKYDAVIYAVSVSIGFAVLENIGYIVRYGMAIALTRAVLAVPAHLSFAVFMGIFYSQAKFMRNRGARHRSRLNMLGAWLVPAGLHAFYDITASLQSTVSTIIYIAFVVAMYITVFFLIKRTSSHDTHN